MVAQVIALLTDFGERDTYVGELKGAILTVNPNVTIIDITHNVPPQDVRAGALLLGHAVHAFPSRAVFVAVVDPGVGSDRRPVLVEAPHGACVGPDNGLFTRVLWEDASAGPHDSAAPSPLPPDARAWRLTNPAYWRRHVSHTFHGRDIFAPVAAHYAAGVPAAEMGDPVKDLLRLPFPKAMLLEGVITGEVVYVDHYGNLVTNVPAGMLPPDAVVEVGGRRVEGLSSHYDGTRPLVALAGSHNTLEVAKPGGNAAEALGVGKGVPVRVTTAAA